MLVFALGAVIFLFTQSRQGRNELSGRPLQGNVAVFGGDVHISEDEHISGNLMVVGDDLTLEGQIGGNLVVVGGDVDVKGHAQVGGNVSVVGGDAVVEGSSVIGGNVAVVGGDVELAGHSHVGGNVRVVGGRIEQDPDAEVDGSISWRIYTNSVAQPNLYSAAPAPPAEPDAPKQPAGPVAQVVVAGESGEEVRDWSDRRRSSVEEAAEAAEEAAEEWAEAAEEAAEEWAEAVEDAAEAAREQAELQREAAATARAHAALERTPWFLVFLGKLVQAFLWTLLITGLVLLFAWLLPKQVRAISATAEKETALSFATGAIGILGSAVLAAILTITICFALLALPLLALLALVLLCGWTVTCYWLGRRLDELVAGPGVLPWNPLISVGLSSLVITGVTAFSWVIFPCLGFIMALLIGSTGTGAVIVHVARGSGRLPVGVLGGGPDVSGPGVEEASIDGGGESAVQDSDFTVREDESVKPQQDDQVLAGEGSSQTATGMEGIGAAVPEDATSEVEPDDLTRVAGIGPVYAGRLQEAGIYSFSQLAGLEVQQIAEILGCPAARVEGERLREQAGELASQE